LGLSIDECKRFGVALEAVKAVSPLKHVFASPTFLKKRESFFEFVQLDQAYNLASKSIFIIRCDLED